MKLPRLSSPLKFFSPAPAQSALGLAGIGGNMMFASGGGGGGFDPDDADYDDFDDQPVEPERRPRATRSSRTPGGDRRDTTTGGRPRTTQFQPEERYWTDYLRIALPVIGLLLMIGLLWFWADRLINDDANPSEPVATEEIGLVVTATPTPPAQIQTTPPPSDATVATEVPATGDNQAGTSQETPPPAETSNQPATEVPADTGATFTDGEAVVVTEDVNLRPNPSTDGEPLMVVPAGEQLTITGGPEEGENFVWWEVVTSDGATTGWVVEQYLEPAG